MLWISNIGSCIQLTLPTIGPRTLSGSGMTLRPRKPKANPVVTIGEPSFYLCFMLSDLYLVDDEDELSDNENEEDEDEDEGDGESRETRG